MYFSSTAICSPSSSERNTDRPSAAIHFRCVKVHTVQLLLHLGRVYLQYAVAHPMTQGVVLHLQHVAYHLQVKRVFCRQSLLKKSRTDVSPCTLPRCTSTGCSSSGCGPPCSPSGASSGVSCRASSRRIVHDVLRAHIPVLHQLFASLGLPALLFHHMEHPLLFALLYPLYFKVLQYLFRYHYT